MHTNEAFLEQLIKNHYKAAQEMTFTVMIHVLLAITAFLILPGMLKESTFKELAGVLGGGVFGGLGFIPGKEILDRREKARNLEAFRPLLQSLNQDSATVDAEKQRIQELFLKLIEKTVPE
jgi:hypothetical protein